MTPDRPTDPGRSISPEVQEAIDEWRRQLPERVALGQRVFGDSAKPPPSRTPIADRALRRACDPFDGYDKAHETRRSLREIARGGHLVSKQAPPTDRSRLLALALVCVGLAVVGAVLLLAWR